MAQLKVIWNDGSREELVEVKVGTDAAEYKKSRFGTPASEVTVVVVEEVQPAPVKKPPPRNLLN